MYIGEVSLNVQHSLACVRNALEQLQTEGVVREMRQEENVVACYDVRGDLWCYRASASSLRTPLEQRALSGGVAFWLTMSATALEKLSTL